MDLEQINKDLNALEEDDDPSFEQALLSLPMERDVATAAYSAPASSATTATAGVPPSSISNDAWDPAQFKRPSAAAVTPVAAVVPGAARTASPDTGRAAATRVRLQHNAPQASLADVAPEVAAELEALRRELDSRRNDCEKLLVKLTAADGEVKLLRENKKKAERERFELNQTLAAQEAALKKRVNQADEEMSATVKRLSVQLEFTQKEVTDHSMNVAVLEQSLALAREQNEQLASELMHASQLGPPGQPQLPAAAAGPAASQATPIGPSRLRSSMTPGSASRAVHRAGTPRMPGKRLFPSVSPDGFLEPQRSGRKRARTTTSSASSAAAAAAATTATCSPAGAAAVDDAGSNLLADTLDVWHALASAEPPIQQAQDSVRVLFARAHGMQHLLRQPSLRPGVASECSDAVARVAAALEGISLRSGLSAGAAAAADHARRSMPPPPALLSPRMTPRSAPGYSGMTAAGSSSIVMMTPQQDPAADVSVRLSQLFYDALSSVIMHAASPAGVLLPVLELFLQYGSLMTIQHALHVLLTLTTHCPTSRDALLACVRARAADPRSAALTRPFAATEVAAVPPSPPADSDAPAADTDADAAAAPDATAPAAAELPGRLSALEDGLRASPHPLLAGNARVMIDEAPAPLSGSSASSALSHANSAVAGASQSARQHRPGMRRRTRPSFPLAFRESILLPSAASGTAATTTAGGGGGGGAGGVGDVHDASSSVLGTVAILPLLIRRLDTWRSAAPAPAMHGPGSAGRAGSSGSSAATPFLSPLLSRVSQQQQTQRERMRRDALSASGDVHRAATVVQHTLCILAGVAQRCDLAELGMFAPLLRQTEMWKALLAHSSMPVRLLSLVYLTNVARNRTLASLIASSLLPTLARLVTFRKSHASVALLRLRTSVLRLLMCLVAVHKDSLAVLYWEHSLLPRVVLQLQSCLDSLDATLAQAPGTDRVHCGTELALALCLGFISDALNLLALLANVDAPRIYRHIAAVRYLLMQSVVRVLRRPALHPGLTSCQEAAIVLRSLFLPDEDDEDGDDGGDGDDGEAGEAGGSVDRMDVVDTAGSHAATGNGRGNGTGVGESDEGGDEEEDVMMQEDTVTA